MDTSLSFSSYYKTVFLRAATHITAQWKQQVFVNILVATISFFLAPYLLGPRYQPDAWAALRVALFANILYLAGFTIYQLCRAPWELDRERVGTLAGVQKSLDAEQKANSKPEVKGELIRAVFDLPYKSQTGSPEPGSVIALELDIWNERQVSTTIRKVWLKAQNAGTEHEGKKLELEGLCLGPSRLEDISKIAARKALQYSVHEHGWLLFYFRDIPPPQSGQLLSLDRLAVGLVDAMGSTHVIEQSECSLKRIALRVEKMGTIVQYIMRDSEY